LELEEPSPHAFIRTSNPKLKGQTLSDEELGIDDIGGLELGELGDKGVYENGVVGCFCGEEEAGRPTCQLSLYGAIPVHERAAHMMVFGCHSITLFLR
jgi:hypothetical protein